MIAKSLAFFIGLLTAPSTLDAKEANRFWILWERGSPGAPDRQVSARQFTAAQPKALRGLKGQGFNPHNLKQPPGAPENFESNLQNAFTTGLEELGLTARPPAEVEALPGQPKRKNYSSFSEKSNVEDTSGSESAGILSVLRTLQKGQREANE